MTTGRFLGVLEQLERECDLVRGTVLATGEGLILAATGCLNSDAAAASAAYLAENVGQNLSLVASTQCVELLVWSPSSVWYLARLPGQCLLMACGDQDGHAGALRLAGSEGARRLAMLLTELQARTDAD